MTHPAHQYVTPGSDVTVCITPDRIAIDGSCEAYEYVLSQPHSEVRHDLGGATIAWATIDNERWCARWPLRCTRDTHSFVAADRDRYHREVDRVRSSRAFGLVFGECRRCLSTLCIAIPEVQAVLDFARSEHEAITELPDKDRERLGAIDIQDVMEAVDGLGRDDLLDAALDHEEVAYALAQLAAFGGLVYAWPFVTRWSEVTRIASESRKET